ncbi:hypothetical protein [Nonomuraea lactucae]|uniref:hypothetical protein n=1 Tax=Nonomuraea lactucae TaxID=2249762 RepID=UPI000DE2C321|nr:hypothetical protein [Nonomuraea lactucae]
MSILLLAATEPDWFARGIGTAGLAVALVGLIFTWRTYKRGGYQIKVAASVETEMLQNYPEGGSTRMTYVNVIVSNHRAGEVQIVRFHGHDGLNPPHEIGLIGDAQHTLKGISQAKWRTHRAGSPNEPAHGGRVRIGAELANGRIVWSNWMEIGPKAAAEVLASRY